MKKFRRIVAATAVILFVGWFWTHLYKVRHVSDGDTFTVATFWKMPSLRLAGIDAPEKSQRYGKESTKRLQDLIDNSYVFVTTGEKDRYGRYSATVYTLPFFTSVNRAMVSEGAAWHYVQYSHDPYLGELETAAKKKKLGLWETENPMPPWEYRKSKMKR
jgi:micrococcal nuclease